MYLTEIDEKTGLVKIDKGNDGVLAIKEFRDIINNKKYGLPCFTAIALAVDYESTIRFYDDNDRPRAAMEEVTGNRDYWEWKNDIIQHALIKYDKLQYNPDVEEIRIYKDQKVAKLKEIQEFDKLSPEDQKAKGTNMFELKKSLRAINKDIQDYYVRTDGKDLFAESPVRNGYELSRLERKIEKRKSFYHTVN